MQFFKQIIIVFLTFTIGVFGVWFIFNFASPQTQIKTISVLNEHPHMLKSETNKQSGNFGVETQNAEQLYYDTEIEKTLKRLVAYKNKNNRNTFYVSSLIHDGIDFVWVFWKEDNSIITLQLSELDEDVEWLYFKHRIDLVKEVVPTNQSSNLGCCLVEKNWADDILAKCKAGKKLTIFKNSK